MIPSCDSLRLPNGRSIPTIVDPFDESDLGMEADSYVPHWLKTVGTNYVSLTRKFSPSSVEPLGGGTIGTVIELGERLPLNKVADMSLFYSAIHGVVAAYINNAQPIAIEKYKRY
jgi:hypothetical protein